MTWAVVLLVILLGAVLLGSWYRQWTPARIYVWYLADGQYIRFAPNPGYQTRTKHWCKHYGSRRH